MRRQARQAQLRRHRRRQRLRRGTGLAAIVAIVAMVLHFTGSTTPSVRTQASLAPTHASRPRATPKPQRPVYGQTPDPVQIHPRLRLPLKAGLVFDVGTGRVLWALDPSQRLPIASLTKMMTALVVVAHSSPRDQVLITRQAIDFSGSGVGLLPLGKRVSELALLYGLLLPSGNDAAIALAQHVAGTRPRFVGLMNAEAAAMGLTCTHFSNVSGIDDHDNYSCARDLAVLARAVLSQPVLAPIVAAHSAILPFPIKGGKLYLYNNNPLLVGGYPGTDGVKTGYTTAAGMCLVATARRGRSWLGVVLLHSGNWATQAMTLLNAGFAALAPPRPPGAPQSHQPPAKGTGSPVSSPARGRRRPAARAPAKTA